MLPREPEVLKGGNALLLNTAPHYSRDSETDLGVRVDPFHLPAPVSVEQLVLDHFARPEEGAWAGAHAENGLFFTLFSIMFADILWPLPDNSGTDANDVSDDVSVFMHSQNESQDAPLLFDSGSFAQLRASAIQARLDTILQCYDHNNNDRTQQLLCSSCSRPRCQQSLSQFIEAQWARHYGRRMRGVYWPPLGGAEHLDTAGQGSAHSNNSAAHIRSALPMPPPLPTPEPGSAFTLALLQGLAERLGPVATAVVCAAFAGGARDWSGGLPDLCLWRDFPTSNSVNGSSDITRSSPTAREIESCRCAELSTDDDVAPRQPKLFEAVRLFDTLTCGELAPRQGDSVSAAFNDRVLVASDCVHTLPAVTSETKADSTSWVGSVTVSELTAALVLSNNANCNNVNNTYRSDPANTGNNVTMSGMYLEQHRITHPTSFTLIPGGKTNTLGVLPARLLLQSLWTAPALCPPSALTVATVLLRASADRATLAARAVCPVLAPLARAPLHVGGDVKRQQGGNLASLQSTTHCGAVDDRNEIACAREWLVSVPDSAFAAAVSSLLTVTNDGVQCLPVHARMLFSVLAVVFPETKNNFISQSDFSSNSSSSARASDARRGHCVYGCSLDDMLGLDASGNGSLGVSSKMGAAVPFLLADELCNDCEQRRVAATLLLARCCNVDLYSVSTAFALNNEDTNSVPHILSMLANAASSPLVAVLHRLASSASQAAAESLSASVAQMHFHVWGIVHFSTTTASKMIINETTGTSINSDSSATTSANAIAPHDTSDTACAARLLGCELSLDSLPVSPHKSMCLQSLDHSHAHSPSQSLAARASMLSRLVCLLTSRLTSKQHRQRHIQQQQEQHQSLTSSFGVKGAVNAHNTCDPSEKSYLSLLQSPLMPMQDTDNNTIGVKHEVKPRIAAEGKLLAPSAGFALGEAPLAAISTGSLCRHKSKLFPCIQGGVYFPIVTTQFYTNTGKKICIKDNGSHQTGILSASVATVSPMPFKYPLILFAATRAQQSLPPQSYSRSHVDGVNVGITVTSSAIKTRTSVAYATPATKSKTNTMFSPCASPTPKSHNNNNSSASASAGAGSVANSGFMKGFLTPAPRRANDADTNSIASANAGTKTGGITIGGAHSHSFDPFAFTPRASAGRAKGMKKMSDDAGTSKNTGVKTTPKARNNGSRATSRKKSAQGSSESDSDSDVVILSDDDDHDNMSKGTSSSVTTTAAVTSARPVTENPTASTVVTEVVNEAGGDLTAADSQRRTRSSGNKRSAVGITSGSVHGVDSGSGAGTSADNGAVFKTPAKRGKNSSKANSSKSVNTNESDKSSARQRSTSILCDLTLTDSDDDQDARDTDATDAHAVNRTVKREFRSESYEVTPSSNSVTMSYTEVTVLSAEMTVSSDELAVSPRIKRAVAGIIQTSLDTKINVGTKSELENKHSSESNDDTHCTHKAFANVTKDVDFNENSQKKILAGLNANAGACEGSNNASHVNATGLKCYFYAHITPLTAANTSTFAVTNSPLSAPSSLSGVINASVERASRKVSLLAREITTELSNDISMERVRATINGGAAFADSNSSSAQRIHSKSSMNFGTILSTGVEVRASPAKILSTTKLLRACTLHLALSATAASASARTSAASEIEDVTSVIEAVSALPALSRWMADPLVLAALSHTQKEACMEELQHSETAVRATTTVVCTPAVNDAAAKSVANNASTAVESVAAPVKAPGSAAFDYEASARSIRTLTNRISALCGHGAALVKQRPSFIKLIEVKGPRDELSTQQTAWLELLSPFIDVEVVYVTEVLLPPKF